MLEESDPHSATAARAPRSARAGLAVHIRGWMLVGGGIPLLVLFFFGYLAAQRALIEASDEHLVSVAEARRSRIEAWLHERVTDLEVISGSKDCIELVQQAASNENHAQVCRYLESFQTGARDYQALALYDLDWNRVALNTSSMKPREVIADEWMKSQLEHSDGPVVAAVHAGGTSDPGLRLGNKLVPPGEPPVGYVIASLDLTGTFAPVLGDRSGLGETGRVYLADLGDGGRILLPRTATASGGGAYVNEEVLERVSRMAIGTAHFREESGKKVFAGFTTIEQRGWLVVAEMDEAEALSLLYSLRRGFLIAGLLTILGVIVFSARVSHLLSAPLAQLAAAARRIKEGRSRERVPELEGREVAEVGHAFNEMLDALEESQRQEIQARTLAAVGELSSGVVHEIRNRLSSVKMNLQALERRVRDDEKYAELGQIAFEQVVRVEGLLNDLLNYARPVELAPAPVRIAEILHASADLLRAEAEERGVRVEIEDRTNGAVVTVDRGRIEEAYSNLVRNAVEASGEGGRIVLRGLPDGEAEGTFVLEVEDDGPGLAGIDPEDLFKPFFTTKDGGTGLGLAHARKIVELHGGRITAGNRAEGGAVFRVEVPQEVVTG